MQYEQFSNPSGDDGKRTLEHMNDHHRSLAEWAIGLLADVSGSILDVGCGGGMLISLLSERFPNSNLTGIDISGDAVEFTKETNRKLVKGGRLNVLQGSVSDLPFKDSKFDLVTAFETYFFWPDLGNDIKELYRVLNTDGVVMIVSETYPHPKFNERNVQLIKDYGMNILGNREMAELMEDAGFAVEIIEVEENNWVAFIGMK